MCGNNILPVKVIKCDGNISNQEVLLKEKVMQISVAQSYEEFATISGKTYIIFDFGKEISGGVRVITYNADGEKKVRLRFGESVSETCAEIGEDNATNDHSLRDFTVELQSYSDMTFGNTGFRFLRTDTEENCTIKLYALTAVSDIDERQQIGKFSCDDKLINEIWDTAAYTLRLCIHNGYFWDGIKRDRLVWIGDLNCEMNSAYCLYGDMPEIRNCLDFAEKEGSKIEWINGIPMFSLWWLIDLYEDYLHTGETDYAKNKLPFINKILSDTEKCVDIDGNTFFPYNFIDWTSHYMDGESNAKREDELIGVNFLTQIAVNAAKLLLTALCEDYSLCDEMLRRLKRKHSAVNEFKQAAALSVLAGDTSESALKVLLSDIYEGQSSFFMYYTLSAMAKVGKYSDALNVMRKYYGGMLSLGATSFWEDFDIGFGEKCRRIDEWQQSEETDFHRKFGIHCYKGFRHSLCHGWSSGVIPYIVRNIVGIRFIGAGQEEFEIDAHLCGLKEVKSVYPTKYGNIEIEYKVIDGNLEKTINYPSELKLKDIKIEL